MSNSSRFSELDIAVTGVFSAVGGALLAVLVTVLFFRQRSNVNDPLQNTSAQESNLGVIVSARRERQLPTPAQLWEDPPVVRAVSAQPHQKPYLERAARKPNFTTYLPSPLSDEELAYDFNTLGASIYNHASTFYGKHWDDDIVVQDDRIPGYISTILEPGDLPMDVPELLKLLSSAENRISAVAFLVSRAICRHIDLHDDVKQSLLPPEIVACLHSMDNPNDWAIGELMKQQLP